MKRLARMVVIVIVGAMVSAGLIGAAHAATFKRGINLSHLFIFPAEDGWPPFRGPKTVVTDAELDRLRAIGLDFIRLPVDPSPFIAATPGQRANLMARIALFARRANAAGLAVLATGYTTDGALVWRPGAEVVPGGQTFEDYGAWIEQLAVTLERAVPGNAAIQLMNEPQTACGEDSDKVWADYQMRLHARVRAVVDMPIVLTGGCWSQIGGLMNLARLPDDPNTLYDVHFYDPFAFTHQSATWIDGTLAYVGGLRFPPARTDLRVAEQVVDTLIALRHEGSAREAARLRADALEMVDTYRTSGIGPGEIEAEFAALAAWAGERGIDPGHVMIGEFGAIDDAPASHRPSRERYLEAIRRAAERHGFGWAMWGYYATFGIIEDDITRRLLPGTLRALGLEGAAAERGGQIQRREARQ